MRKFSLKHFLIIVILLISSITGLLHHNHNTTTKNDTNYDKVIYLPSDRYPKTALHMEHAFKKGFTHICTIDRKGVKENRKHSLQGIATKRGYDRDEYPMAMCKEGGTGADVELIPSADNRGAGSWVSHQLSGLKDGTKVRIEVK
ncbi:hypothetical protein J5Y03_00600 [Bacillus sp. RG28]|uniref:Deoxyribonuclease NucA/NucB domain-containing protein n=1 Tax=Gottfriedia endophytica TaxID=2820819 RepID=A0A940NJL3_9BACI|nr:NucA/NucB deoxyribonuclease domain-containing protein [Gottfriedia endophytica]MBP0723681.1 hypothetical protein [Gottfriedia endophytica]